MEGLKRRLKDYRRTPKTMTRAPKVKVESGKENVEPNDSEDCVSYDRHIKAMEKESRKVHPNPSVISDLMKLTYSGRRREIVDPDSVMWVSEIVERFPFLKNHDEVS